MTQEEVRAILAPQGLLSLKNVKVTVWNLRGILPLEPSPLIAHCGKWWRIKEVPIQLPCCGYILEEKLI